MKKGIKLVAVAAALVAAQFSACTKPEQFSAHAKLDLYGVQRDVASGKKTIVIPAEARDSDLPAIVACIKGAAGITLDLNETEIKTIGYGAFRECNALKTIILPKELTSIGDDAFRECKSLTSIVIPTSVTSIGVRAFRDCKALAQVRIPSSVISIGGNAFYYDRSALKEAMVQAGLERITSAIEWFVSISNPDESESLEQITIPDRIMNIEDDATSWYGAATWITFADTRCWYFDEGFTQPASEHDLAENLGEGRNLYKKPR